MNVLSSREVTLASKTALSSWDAAQAFGAASPAKEGEERFGFQCIHKLTQPWQNFLDQNLFLAKSLRYS